MIIDGYSDNPYPFEIGDILLEKDDPGSLCILMGANYAYARLLYITSELATGQEGTCRILESTEEYKRVGHIDMQGIEVIRTWLTKMRKVDG